MQLPMAGWRPPHGGTHRGAPWLGSVACQPLCVFAAYGPNAILWLVLPACLPWCRRTG